LGGQKGGRKKMIIRSVKETEVKPEVTFCRRSW